MTMTALAPRRTADHSATDSVDEERSPKETSLFRAGEALSMTRGITGTAQGDLQVLMCDLLHHADNNGLDLRMALQDAAYTFALERSNPDFTHGR